MRRTTRLDPGWRGWLPYILPALIVYLVFMAYPLIDSIRLSLYTGAGANREWAGMYNYARLFNWGSVEANRYWGAFGNTWIFFAIHMLVQNVLGITFAAMLTNATMKGRQIYQTIIFLPTTLAVLVTGYLWKLMLNPTWTGEIMKDLGLGALSYTWLGDPNTALATVALVSCWQWVGIPTMMFVAAFRNIPDELMEASAIEGAGTAQQFFRIKLPMIKPVVGMVTVLTFVNNFNAFDAVYALEGVNGPPAYSTDLIGTLFYRMGIAGEQPAAIPDPGLGAAIATLTFLMLCCGVIPTLLKTQTKGGD